MKKLLTTLLLAGIANAMLAQTTEHSPFLEYGYDKPIVFTASYGVFEEFHDFLDTVKIGKILFDWRNSKIVGFIEEEEVRNDILPLSVDPHAHRYWWVSPYAYCNNNPLIYIDPDGRDIWTIFEDGTINRQIDKKIDRIDVVDKDGNTITGTEAKYGTIKQHTTSVNVNGKNTKIDFFDIKGDDLAKETFENITNNTSIEWGHAKIGTENSGRNIVGTSHEKNSTAILGFLFATNYTLKEIIHNHPNGVPLPSFADMKAAESFQGKFPNIIQNIYINGNKGGYDRGYYLYNNKGPSWGPICNPKY